MCEVNEGQQLSAEPHVTDFLVICLRKAEENS